MRQLWWGKGLRRISQDKGREVELTRMSEKQRLGGAWSVVSGVEGKARLRVRGVWEISAAW